MKKTLSVLLMILITLTLFAGGETETSGKSNVVYSPPGMYPILEEGETTVNFMISTHTTINDNYEENTFTRMVEELTGVNLDFTYLPEGAETKTKLNLLLSSSDYTDGILGKMFTLMEQQLYADQGILIPLSDMIEEYGVNTKKAFAQFPEIDVESYFKLLDGQLYCLPNLVLCYHCEVAQKMWVYQPWLDALGLDLPETTDEFRDMLIAFKTQDPNGNGIADEIPMAGATTGWFPHIEEFIMNAFVRYDASYLSYINNGKVTPSFNQDGWREGLRYMHKLYTEGLIAPESFTQKSDQLILLGENPEASLVGAAPGGTMGNVTQINGESGRWADWTCVPALEGPQGVREVGRGLTLGNESAFYLTDKVDEPLAAFRIGDLLYDKDMFMRANFGEEDVVWRWANDGEKGIDGKQGVWFELIPMNKREKNTTWYQRIPELQPLSFRMGRVVPEGPHLEKILYSNSRDKMYEYASPRETVLPPLIYSEADAERMVELDTTFREYIMEMIPRFITGNMNIESDWDKYLKELDAIGLDEYVELMQAAYNKKFK